MQYEQGRNAHYGQSNNVPNGEYDGPEDGQHHITHNGQFNNASHNQHHNLPHGSLYNTPYGPVDNALYGQLDNAPYGQQDNGQYGQRNNLNHGQNGEWQPDPQFTALQAANHQVRYLDSELTHHRSIIEELRTRCDEYRRERDDARKNAETLALERWEKNVLDADKKAKQMEQKADEMERRAQDAENKVWTHERKIQELEFKLSQHGRTIEIQSDFMQKTPSVKKELQTPHRGFTGAADARSFVYHNGSPTSTEPALKDPRRAPPNASFVPPPLPGHTNHTGRSLRAAMTGHDQGSRNMTWGTEDSRLPSNTKGGGVSSKRKGQRNPATLRTPTPAIHGSTIFSNPAQGLLFGTPVPNAQKSMIRQNPTGPMQDSMVFGNPPPAPRKPIVVHRYGPPVNPGAVVLHKGGPGDVQWAQQFDSLFREVEQYTRRYTHEPNEIVDDNLSKAIIGAFMEFTTAETARMLLKDATLRYFLVARLINTHLVTHLLRIGIMRGFSSVTDMRIKDAHNRTVGDWPIPVRNAALVELAETAQEVISTPGFDHWMHKHLDSIGTRFWDFIQELLAPNVNRDTAYQGFKHIYNEATRVSLLMAGHPLTFDITFPESRKNTSFNPTTHLNVDPLIHDIPRNLVRGDYMLQLAVSPCVVITNYLSTGIEPKTFHLSRVILREKVCVARAPSQTLWCTLTDTGV